MTGILVALLVIMTAALSFVLGMIFGVAIVTKQNKTGSLCNEAKESKD